MPLDKATVARIAHLARIATTDAERARLAGELSGIIEWVEQLGEVDTSDVEPMTSVVDMPLKARSDEVTDGGAAEEVTGHAPQSAHGFLVVPKVVE